MPHSPRRLTPDQRRLFNEIDDVSVSISVLIFDARNHLMAGDKSMAQRVLKRALASLPEFDEKLSLTIAEGCR